MNPTDPRGAAEPRPVSRKRWTAPLIVQHDLLETVAAICQPPPTPGPGQQAKAAGLSCNIVQT